MTVCARERERERARERDETGRDERRIEETREENARARLPLLGELALEGVGARERLVEPRA